MRAVQSFRVEPTIPQALAGLTELARNVQWTWQPAVKSLFERLDRSAWTAAGGDPIRTIELVSADRWDALVGDADYVADVAAAAAALASLGAEERWFQERSSPLSCVAYFSPEFGLTETLAQYSGGLGVLAGDHLKSASDLGVPLVAVGLLYREGYFRQRLSGDGWQQERFPVQDPNGLAMTHTGKSVTVDIGGEQVVIDVWRVDVGRIPLLVLDTDVEGNSAAAQAITDRLYGGDTEHRIRQEIVLGIGGVRALRACGYEPQVFHTNEGHAGFLSLERIREHVAAGLSFAEAVEAVRAGGVFTTHTPVPAGIDRFPVELMQKYFGTFAGQIGITFDQFMAIGRRNDEPGETRFNMAVMGLRLAARSNGVAALHGEVSRDMFRALWGDIPVDEVPIGSITNGVHAHTWVAPRMSALLSEGVHPIWDGADEATWERANKLDDHAVWAARNDGRRELVDFVRARMGGDLLDPNALTIGFARRFATYKRATLLLSEKDRLISMLRSADRPVQFIFAGKAHPADQPGKEMIQAIDQFSRAAGVQHRLVFLPDYDMSIARAMYKGCDVWLNNPRRPQEACGTSGMKAALNGSLNCSVLDGWWPEAYDGMSGWAIESYEDEPDMGRRDTREAASLFALLEQEIVPMFYDRHDGVPGRWLERVKHAWSVIGPQFTASRMVREYVTTLYEPAASGAAVLGADGAAAARALAAWKATTRSSWNALAVSSVGFDGAAPAGVGSTATVVATVALGSMPAESVAVQAVHGPLDANGSIGDSHVVPLSLAGQDGGTLTFRGEMTATVAGPYGCTVRAIPTHPHLAHHLEMGLVTWAQ